RRTCGRTKRRDVKPIVTKSLCRQFIERRCRYRPAERGWIAEPGIINQDEQNVRRIWRSVHWLREGRDGAFQRPLRYALEQLGWTRQHASIPFCICSGGSGYLWRDRKCDRDEACH